MKYRKYIFCALLVFNAVISRAESAADVLAIIERNNTTLAALRQQADAEKIGNRTDIALADPEIGFDYLWGSPSAIGSRKDFSLSQSFDVATLSGNKSRLANMQDELVEWHFRAERMKILLEAKLLVLDVIYYNKVLIELNQRKVDCERFLGAQHKRLSAGDANILEYNDARLESIQINADVSQTKAERNVALAELSRLNGGYAIDITDNEYPGTDLPLAFDDWYANAEKKNPVLAYVRHDVEVNKKRLTIVSQQGLPSISVGYMGEKTMGELYHGISLGVTVPLWSNKNKVRQAKAEISAAEARQSDAKLQVYGQLETLYRRACGLRQVSDTYHRALNEANTIQLLRKALEAGEISVIDYLTQIKMYYNSIDKLLSAEHEYQRALAELVAVEL